MSSEEVRLESTVAGFTASGRLHTLSVWFVLALRLMMGLAFLQSGVDKVLSGSFGAGRVLGLDAYIEQYDVGGEPLVERHPWTRYVLG